MHGYANSGKIDVVLRDLHDKKRWLDTMIDGLEKALDSPDLRFIESVTEVLDKAPLGQPLVDIQKRNQERLADLAAQVGYQRLRRRGEPEAVQQPAAH